MPPRRKEGARDIADSIVIGIDGGGTSTRALAADLTGRVLAHAQSGAASPDKSPDAERNTRQAIEEVLCTAKRKPVDVVALVAGIAGLNRPEDQEWATRFTALPGLECPRIHVNDAVVAHNGAFGTQPGIIAIAGTGCVIFGITSEGRQIRNYDFRRYARAAARHLAQDAVYMLLAGHAAPGDAGFAAEILRFWAKPDLGALREIGARGFIEDTSTRNRLFADMAPLVTEAAGCGAPLARLVCNRAAEALATDIRLVGGCFAEDTVPVALIGAVARSPIIAEAVQLALAGAEDKSYRVVEPQLSCTAGAVLLALQVAGVAPTEALARRLREAPGSERLR